MVFAAGLSYRYVVGAVLLACLPVVVYPGHASAVPAAPAAWRSSIPWADPLGDGFQIIQSLIAVGTGGVDRPRPHGRRPEAVLPARAAHRLHLRGHRRGARPDRRDARRSSASASSPGAGCGSRCARPTRFGAFLALGLTTMIAVQAFVNMSVVLGLVPTKGIPLPFVSAGGSSLLINLLGMGVLLNVSQHASTEA